jgi:hypothetical protein
MIPCDVDDSCLLPPVDHWLKDCGDLANASKHFVLDRRKPIANSVSTQSGYGVGRYGVGLFGQGEESITIELSDGASFGCLDLVREVVSTWQRFFSANAPGKSPKG